MEEFFYTCEHFPKIDEKYINEALSSHYMKTRKPNVIKADIPCSFINSDFYAKIKKDLYCSEPKYLKWPANMLYDWHADGWGRNVSINIPLVASENSITLFRSKLRFGKDSTFFNVHKVNYILHLPTILNVKHEHCVINFSNEDRYVINIGFGHVSYETVVEYFKNTKIESY